jgi:hypothetical protein
VWLVAALLSGIAAVPGRAQVAPKPSENPFNDEMLKMTPQEQAAKLADHLGIWCIGTKPFFMGMTRQGPAKGYAYWNVTCAGGQAYMVQLPPDGHGSAIDCKALKEQGRGRECYKAF